MTQFDSYLEDFKYFLSIERSLSPNTVTSYLIDCSRFVDFLNTSYPEIKAKQITPKIINSFLDTIVKKKKKTNKNTKTKPKKPNSPTKPISQQKQEDNLLKATSLTRIIQSLRAFFKYLTQTDVVKKDVSKLIVTPKLEQKLPTILENKEIFQIIHSIDTSTYYGFRNKVSIELLYATGLRVSEFINLKLENINVKEEYLDIIGKGNKERYIPIAQGVLKDLLTYINDYRGNNKIDPKSKDYVFLSYKRGKKLTRQFINKMLNEVALQAGITKSIHPHILRHSFATELIKEGASLVAVKAMMGHESLRSTQIYINLQIEDIRRDLQRYHPIYKSMKE